MENKSKKIEVMVVEDSMVARELLVHILESSPDISVIATAKNGVEALKRLETYSPDLITMDVNMPEMDGLEATARILEQYPIPIIIVSAALDPEERANTFKIIEVGALALLDKPHGITDPDFEKQAQSIVEMVKMMSEIKIMKRKQKVKSTPASKTRPNLNKKFDIAAIGVSTGGPPVLKEIFSKISPAFPLPILVVQHIADGFDQSLVDWLNIYSKLPIHIAKQDEQIVHGHIYMAPSGKHMTISKLRHISLIPMSESDKHCPSVGKLFQSVSNIYSQNAVGIILSGMGNDGVPELKMMKDKGALTIAQDRESSIIHGMPGEAIKIGAATNVQSIEEIIQTLNNIGK